MSKAIRWSDEQLRDYEAKLGRPLKLAKPRPDPALAEVPLEPKKKYRNQKTTVDGIPFDSKREAARYRELVAMVDRGEISTLIRQLTFELAPAVQMEGSDRKTPALRYKADFVYLKGGRLVVEDVKGMKTRVYLQKKHLMKTVHGIDILET